MTQNSQTVVVNVYAGRRRWRFPLLGLVGFCVAFFWPLTIWHGVLGGILEAAWVAMVAIIWSVVFLARAVS
jgi:hypothetical protein